MKLVVITTPTFFIEEHNIINMLFEEGLDTLHLRKPDSEPIYCERLLSLIDNKWLGDVVVHDHFYLKDEYSLKGIHLNRRNNTVPTDYKGSLSRSCHSLDEVSKYKNKFDYMFLSPIFDSISKAGYNAGFSAEELYKAKDEHVINEKVYALGGISQDNIDIAKGLGFGGVVLFGALWKYFDNKDSHDYKSLIDFFSKVRKLTL